MLTTSPRYMPWLYHPISRADSDSLLTSVTASKRQSQDLNPGPLTAKPRDLSSAPPVPRPGGPRTSVSEQRWADLQVSLLPEPRAVFFYVQIKEALPPRQSFQHVCYQHPNPGCQARGFRGPRGRLQDTRGVGGGHWELTDTALF